MNYLSFYELRREPFSNAPVSHFYYGSPQHARALVRLMHAVESMKGLAVMIGDIGAGKTTTARRLLESLPEDQYEAALLVMVQDGVSPQWLLTKIAYQLGVTHPSEDKTRLLGQLYRRLYALYESGRKAVVLIDEAQMLTTRELMAEIRGLLNMEIPDQKLLTILFFGLPELEENLKLDLPLYQRIAVRCRLAPLGPEANEAYIKHRLKMAGATRMLFTQEAVRAIHRASSGIPRLINTICDNALFEGFLSRTNPVNARIIERVVNDLGYDGVTERGGYEAGAGLSYGGEGDTVGRIEPRGRADVLTYPRREPASGPAESRAGGLSVVGDGARSAGQEGAAWGESTAESIPGLGVTPGAAPRHSSHEAGARGPAVGRVGSDGEGGTSGDKLDEIDSILAALEEK